MAIENGIQFSTNEMLQNVTPMDSTVEIIGFVESMSAPENVGSKKEFLTIKFLLNNGKGIKVQVKIWNEQIARIKHSIRPNSILHIDGAFARSLNSVSNFNTGNVNYELIIQSNTVVTSIGKHEKEDYEDEVYNDCPLENLGREKSKLISQFEFNITHLRYY